jgi:hypothetical protein
MTDPTSDQVRALATNVRDVDDPLNLFRRDTVDALTAYADLLDRTQQQETDVDAAIFLTLLISQCADGPNDHSWRTCRRCLAVHQLEMRDPFAVRLVQHAISRVAASPGTGS